MKLKWVLCFCLVLAMRTGHLTFGQQPTPTSSSNPVTAQGSQSDEEETSKFWVGSFSDFESQGIMVGCESYLLPVSTRIARGDDQANDLQAALEALFDPEQNHPAAETEDWVKMLNLSVESISIIDGEADIELGGTLLGIGSCGDAILEAQILQTVFQFESIERVKVTDGVTNLREATHSMHDELSAEQRKNYVYTRPDDSKIGDEEAIKFWVGSFSDFESQGIMVGCESYLLPVSTRIARGDDLVNDLQFALEALFDPEQNHSVAETEDWVKQLNLSVESISIVDGEAVVDLGGGLMGIGSCGDAILEAQILQTIFQFESIESALVRDGRFNLRQVTDMSERFTLEQLRDHVYLRPEN